jgi:phosphohistidine swiveling domain-containing protein
MTKKGWIKEYAGNVFFHPLMSELYDRLAYENILKITGFDEKHIAIVQQRSDDKEKNSVWNHTAGALAAKEFYFNGYIKGDLFRKYQEFHDKLQSLHKARLKDILSNNILPVQEVIDMIALGAALHLMTQPHCIAKIEEELHAIGAKRLPKKSMVLELIQPSHETTLNKERIAWLNMLLKVKKGDVTEELDDYYEKYSLLKVIHRAVKKVNPVTPIEDFKDNLEQEKYRSTKEIEKELSDLKEDIARVIKRKQELFDKYSFTDAEKRMFEVHSMLGHYRLEGRLVWQIYFTIIEYYKRSWIAKKLDADEYITGMLSYEEFMASLDTGEVPKRKYPNLRLYYKGEEGKWTPYFDEDAEKMIKRLDIPFFVPKTDKLKGEIAYPGIVKGKARVILWDRNFEKSMKAMKDGEILIVDQTKPSLMEAIRKASAIVTNEGGLISHAAIVSRELKIPCLIQTGFATDVFKTGDDLIVDAETGEVRKDV